MKATVTRSATKGSVTKATGKTATTATNTTPVAKPAKPPAKSAATRTARATAPAPTPKTAAATSSATSANRNGTTATKAAPTVLKSSSKAAGKSARATEGQATNADKVTAAAKSGTVTTAARKSERADTTAQHLPGADAKWGYSGMTEPGRYVSSNKASPEFTDKIQQTVVSKVSEVATKTTKPTPTAAAGETLLTEEQILQMSDKDYMNEAQLAFFKARLQQLEKDLLKNAGETTEHLRETVLVPDPADRATIEEEHALELRTRDRERKLLKKVQQALASIESGEYGWCEETGEPIGIPRLLARPTATLSLEAQQRRELKQKLYGD